jgi:periplasmic protein TonB
MFNNLIESKRVVERSFGGTVVSLVLHVAVIALLVVVTLHAGEKIKDKVEAEDVKFAEVKKDPPPEPDKKPPPPDVPAAPPPPKGFQVLQAPVNIPDKIPDVDLSKAVTDEADFTGKGVAGGTSKGVEGGTPTDQPMFEFQVEKPALGREGNPMPHYPSLLQDAHVVGEVLVQFVVDTLGKPEMATYKVLKASNELFAQEVHRVLPYYKFYPAEAGGRKVKQYVQQPFTFIQK